MNVAHGLVWFRKFVNIFCGVGGNEIIPFSPSRSYDSAENIHRD